jgi:hypothetical protein
VLVGLVLPVFIARTIFHGKVDRSPEFLLPTILHHQTFIQNKKTMAKKIADNLLRGNAREYQLSDGTFVIVSRAFTMDHGDEVMMFKGYMRTAQRLAAFPEPSPATDQVLTVLKEKCCNLMRKHLSGQLRELGQLGELRELRKLTDLLRQLRR